MFLTDGNTRWIETILSQQIFLKKNCIVTVSRDITDRKNEDKIRNLIEINID